jgi:hypothetical protein
MIDIVLLVLKIGVLVLLYLFIWYVVKRAVGNVRTPSGAAVAAAPDVAIPDGSRVFAAVTLEEREARRESRLSERTMGGESLDLSGNIDPRLIVESSPIVPQGVVFPLQGWITVGRAHTSDIVLDENYVSSTHARFVPRGQFYVVEDLGSTNGTFVNEKLVTEAQLKLDSRVRIGETIFRYEE